MENPQEYYKSDGPMTAPGGRASEFSTLPDDLGMLCQIAQGLLIHRDMAPFAYDLQLSEERRDEAHTRSVADILTQIHRLDDSPLKIARPLDHRMAGVCRHFTVLFCAMLHSKGIPARARCGFGAYFNRGKFEDHWVTEYWNDRESRWILVDAQLDVVQRKLLKIDFDPLDVPRDRFIIAGDAWQRCRIGKQDPSLFGLSYIGLQGLWFIAGNVLRDLASLNRMELLPWDVWGLMPKDDASFSDDAMQFIDRVAALILGGDKTFPQVREIYTDDRLRVPSIVFNVLRNTAEPIDT